MAPTEGRAVDGLRVIAPTGLRSCERAFPPRQGCARSVPIPTFIPTTRSDQLDGDRSRGETGQVGGLERTR